MNVWTLTRHFDAWESSEIGIFSSSEIAGASALARADDIDRVVVRQLTALATDNPPEETVLKESSDPWNRVGELWVVQECLVQEAPLLPLDATSEVKEQLEEAEAEDAYWDALYSDVCDDRIEDWVDDY